MDYCSALIADGVPPETAKAFIDYHLENPEIWKAFEQVALELIDCGHQHSGAGAITEIIRYKKSIEQRGDFKVNHNYRAYYARIFQIKHPEHRDFLKTREVKGLKEAA